MSQLIDFSVQLPLILRVQQMKFDTQKYYKLKISISISCAVIFAVYISNSIIKSSRESCVVANYCIFSLSKASTKNESKFLWFVASELVEWMAMIKIRKFDF